MDAEDLEQYVGKRCTVRHDPMETASIDRTVGKVMLGFLEEPRQVAAAHGLKHTEELRHEVASHAVIITGSGIAVLIPLDCVWEVEVL